MQLSPRMYHWLIRPVWFTKRYIHDPILAHYNLEGKSVLDFGCGTGANCRICHPKRYMGIDPDLARIRLASQIYPDHVFRRFHSDTIPAEDDAFDYVLIVAVLHHIPDHLLLRYTKEFKRVLKPNGELILIEPYECPTAKLNNRFMKWYDNGAYIRKEDEYVQLLQAGGFDTQVLKKFTKCFLYNEMFFQAQPQVKTTEPDPVQPYMIVNEENVAESHP